MFQADIIMESFGSILFDNTVKILCIGTDRSQQNSADQDQTASEEAV